MRTKMTQHQTGQGNVEYALLLVLVILGAVLILTIFGIDLQGVYCRVVSAAGFSNACGSYFTDDFSNLSNWDIVSGSWLAQNGNLLGGPNEGRIFHNLSQNDYTLTVNGATLNQGNGYGLWFRATNTKQVNGYTFQYDPGYGAFVMRKWVNGNELAPFAIANASGYNWYTSPRQIQIVAKGSTYTAYVDGKQVLQGTDSTYTQGGVGFRTWDSTTAQFGSISVDPVK